MLWAKEDTAKTVTVGPVLDADGVAVTGGVVADFKIAKNGGAPAALNGSATLTHRHTGFYSLALTASDLDTLGTAEVTIDDTVNACPMKELMVLPANVYDALTLGTDYLQVDAREIGGLTATNAPDRAVVFETTIASVTSQTIWVLTDGPSTDDAVNEYVIDVYDAANAYEFSTGHYGADYVGASKTLTANAAPAFTVAAGDKVVFRPKSHVWAVRGNMTGSAASVTGNVGGSVASVLAVGPGGITAASHEVGAITANAIAADALGASELSAGACEKIADIVLRRLMTNVEASASGDTPGVGSLYGLVQQMQESNLVDNAGFLTVYKTDGTTELGQKAVTTDAAGEPVTGIS
jgi:hypothetical protein